MRMNNEVKLKCVELTHDIKNLCNQIESTILKAKGHYCFESGNFSAIDSLYKLAKELKEMNVAVTANEEEVLLSKEQLKSFEDCVDITVVKSYIEAT